MSHKDEAEICKGRFPHNWHVGRFGGATCGRCGKKSRDFTIKDGRIEVAE